MAVEYAGGMEEGVGRVMKEKGRRRMDEKGGREEGGRVREREAKGRRHGEGK